MTNIAETAEECNVIPTANHNITASPESILDESVSESGGDEGKTHGFSKTLAQVKNKDGEQLGWNAAIILRYLSFMVRKYGTKLDGKKWVRINLDHISKQYPYLGRSTLDENVIRLKRFGCCEIENLNRKFKRPKYDRTRCYHVPQEWMDATEDVPRYFDAAIAAEVGVPAAAIYHNFCHWIDVCKEKKLEERVHLKPETLVDLLPFSKPTIKRAIKTLIEHGFIIPVEGMKCWYNYSVAGSKADEVGSKADKDGSNPDKGGSKADNYSINSILIDSLEKNSKEKAALSSSELPSDERNNICSSDYSTQASITTDADGQGGIGMGHEENIVSTTVLIPSNDDILGSASNGSIEWPHVENYQELHLINLSNNHIALAIEKDFRNKNEFLDTVDDVCRHVMGYLDEETIQKLYYECTEDEVVATLLPFLQDYFSCTRIDRDGILFELIYYGSLECVVGAFLFPENNTDSYFHGIGLLNSVTYDMHLTVWSYFNEIHEKAVEEEFAERRKQFASVDEHREHIVDAAPAEKTRIFRNGINARNEVGWIFYNQKCQKDCININAMGLKLIQKLFVLNPEVSAGDLLAVMDACLNLYVNQPSPQDTIRHGDQWHARHGAQDVFTFAIYLKAIVRDVGYTKPIVFLGDAQEQEEEEDEMKEALAA